MSHFDERSGMVYSSANWGQWGQTIEEVYVEINVPEGTSPKNIHCNFKPKSLLVTVNGNEIIKVQYMYLHVSSLHVYFILSV